MKSILTTTRTDWVALCLVVLCFTAYGCKDSASISDKPNVPLASLTVTPSTLQPTFSSDTTSYTAETPTAATSVTITATPQDNTVTVSIDGTITTQRTIALSQPGSTKTVLIVLTTQTGTESTYAVNVTRLLSGDNNLKTTTVTPGPLIPAFTSDQLTYTVDVATNITSVTVTATKSDPEAVMSGDLPSDGRATIQLDGPGTSKTMSITVTAPNQTSKTYRITVLRAASSNNNLSGLHVKIGAGDQPLSPTFSPGETRYNVEVGTKVSSITLEATKADPSAVISGDVPNEGQATIQLDGPGTQKDVSVHVAAQNGSIKTYTITVTRAAPSSNNNLSVLSVTSGTLSPPFTAAQLAYTVDVPTNVANVDVSATKADPDAVMSGSVSAGTGQASGQASIALGMPGTATTMSITVTAPNGTFKTYTVTINRRASSDSTLAGLNVTVGSLDPPFASNTVNYTVAIDLLVDSVTISATKTDPNATLSSLGTVIAAPGTPTGQMTVSPQFGIGTTIDMTVIAQDGINTTTHTITVTRGLF
ncbi:MAG TPA: cadherin-like beta sandwich domain-containing protein [Nitrospira sp.]|nr:cadherin-like beta sandwich domain-containing protein [Nitrospira sp.]